LMRKRILVRTTSTIDDELYRQALLASVLLIPGVVLWSIDKNLDALSTRLGVSFRSASA
jgi:hypothetical protein